VNPARSLVIGSRGSQLALWQAEFIRGNLAALGIEARIEIIKTAGDRITDLSLAVAGAQSGAGKGLFTREIEDALLAGRIDLAVHSLKDLPTELPEGLTLAAIPARANPFDALVGRRLEDLPRGARVGTSSLRRSAQLLRQRPDLEVVNLRGNVDTRLRKLDEGQCESIVLAAAGLLRLGWSDRIAELMPPDVMCPAVGQGALAIETRQAGDGYEMCTPLDDPPTRLAVTAERALLSTLNGGCQVPVGAFAKIEDERLCLRAIVISPDGATAIAGSIEGELTRPAAAGHELGQRLLRQGAAAILDQVYAVPRDRAV